MQGAEKLGDDALYWRIFFKAGKRDGLGEVAAGDHERGASRPGIPPGAPAPHAATFAGGGWSVSPSTALALYRRDPGVARPFLTRLLGEVDTTLSVPPSKLAMTNCSTSFSLG